MSQENFESVLKNFGLSANVADKLWNGNIRSIKELASSKTSAVCEVVDDPVLNTILPVLQKYSFPIVMAEDPDSHALTLLRRHAQNGDEEMTSNNETASDAVPYVTDYSRSGQPTANRHPAQGPRNFAFSQTTTQVNHGDRTETQVMEEMDDVSTRIVIGGTPQTINYGKSMNFNITGGNITQANFGGTVTYNNQNATITSTVFTDSKEARAQMRALKVEPTALNIHGMNISTSAFAFAGEGNYWIDGVVVKPASAQDYDKHLKDNSVYPMKPRKSGRALIINNITFNGGVAKRAGAEVDTMTLQRTLSQLGFDVQVHENKKKRDIEGIVREFTNAGRNKTCSVSFVFIGSHGERENNQDYFIDTENKHILVNDVISQFTASKCSKLNGKPKLFFFQFCRKDKHIPSGDASARTGGQHQPGSVASDTQSDAGPDEESAATILPHDEADMLLSFATAAGTKAYRDTQDGSWYVTALCKVLQSQSKSEDLLSMMTMVNQAVMAKHGEENTRIVVQMAQLQSTLAKKVKFFP